MKERSYLPGYVLVEAALVGEVAHHLRNTPNVIGFLGGSEKPVPLRQSEVNRILGTVDELQETGEELNIPLITNARLASAFINAFCTMTPDDLAIKSWAEYK